MKPMGEIRLPRLTRGLAALMTATLVVLTGKAWAGGPPAAGRVSDGPEAIIYQSPGKTGERRPVVFAFAPSGDAKALIRQWRGLADRYGLIVYASKSYRNHLPDLPERLPVIKAQLDRAMASLPVEPGQVILTGMSGGGSFAQALNLRYPGFASALLINTGRIWEPFYAEAYEHLEALRGAYAQAGGARLAVMLMSPTDFRYGEMQRDCRMLTSLGWQVHPMEFAGGHTLAPQAVYRQALEWIFAQPGWHGARR